MNIEFYCLDCWETKIRHHRNHEEENLDHGRSKLLASSGSPRSKELVDEMVDKDGPVFRYTKIHGYSDKEYMIQETMIQNTGIQDTGI